MAKVVLHECLNMLKFEKDYYEREKKQNAISFIQKNQNSKRIFLSNYLSSESDYLSQESNQSIKNNFDQMQVKSTKKALTQMINGSRDMQ